MSNEAVIPDVVYFVVILGLFDSFCVLDFIDPFDEEFEMDYYFYDYKYGDDEKVSVTVAVMENAVDRQLLMLLS